MVYCSYAHINPNGWRNPPWSVCHGVSYWTHQYWSNVMISRNRQNDPTMNRQIINMLTMLGVSNGKEIKLLEFWTFNHKTPLLSFKVEIHNFTYCIPKCFFTCILTILSISHSGFVTMTILPSLIWPAFKESSKLRQTDEAIVVGIQLPWWFREKIPLLISCNLEGDVWP